MAYNTYRISLKSEEERGASQPNIVELEFNSDADANTFGSNLEACISGINVTNDLVLNSNYALPYPVGTDSMTRTAWTDGSFEWANIRIYDTPSGFTPSARVTALIAAGFKFVNKNGIWVPNTGNCQVFTPGHSV